MAERMALKVKIAPVRVYQVQGADGRLLGMFHVESSWNGFMELRQLDGAGRTLIVAGPEQGDFGRLFVDIFGGRMAPPLVEVLKASPDLLAAISDSSVSQSTEGG